MDNQTASLWNGHEVTGHAEVCYRYRPAFSNLAFKDWNDTTTATKNIPKTNRTVGRLATLVKASDNQLRHALGCSHNIWWINRLICRNHNHLRYFGFINSLSNIVSSTNIVFEGFFWIALHHRNVLMGCRMINNSWLVLLKDLQQTVIVLNICDNWHIINPLELANQFMINKVD